MKLRITIISLLLLCFADSMSAQSNDVNQEKEKELETQSNVVYETVDENPKFPGGSPVLQAFLIKNLKYPEEARKKEIEGKVLVSFVIAKDGSIEEIKSLNQVHPLLDSEAIRVVKLLPNWEPGKKDGKVVRVRFTLPINFKLPKDDIKKKSKKRVAL